MNSRSLKFREDIIGKSFTNSYGDVATVVDVECARMVLVEFLGGFRSFYQKDNLIRGNFLSPYSKTIHNVGYLGEGDYTKYDLTGKTTCEYNLWRNMLNRVFNKNYHSIRPTYTNVGICDDWLNFQNFAEWCNCQKGFLSEDEKGSLFVLDKDLLGGMYSPENCCFIPAQINSFLTLRKKCRGDLPIGVSFQTGKYKAYNTISKKFKYFSSAEEAFCFYKVYKEIKSKSLADKWKDQIDSKVHIALMEYEVGIND